VLIGAAYGQSSNPAAISIIVENSWMSRMENASVYMDGVYQGVTDNHGNFVIDKIAPGQHNITIAKSGFVTSSIDREFNGPDSLEFKLMEQKSATGVTILVLDDRVSKSKISGASISVDGQFAGRTSNGTGILALELTPGLHTFSVSKDQLDTNTTEINVVPGSTYEILMTGGGRHLSILDGQLFIYSLSKEITYGLVNTLKLSIVAFAVGILIGLLMGIGRTSSNPLFRYASSIYVEGVRGLPILLQLLFINFGLPFLISDLTGQQFNIDAFMACIIALSVNSGAYMGEIFKAGIQAVNKGQTEAARSLGMTPNQSLQYVILPQAFKIVLPPLGNEFIALIKDSSIGLVIAVTEVTMEAKLVGVEYYNTFTPLLAAGLIYLCITIPLGKLVQYMEKRFNTSTRKVEPVKKQKVGPLPEEVI
jgi:polar amino acid transport system permease protein